MKKLEKLLGRKLKKMEVMLYEMKKDDRDYRFEKDRNGNLTSIRNKNYGI